LLKAALAVPCCVPGLGALIFVRVNQVLVRLWARPIAKSDRMVVGASLRTSCGRNGVQRRVRFHCVRAGAYCLGGFDGSCCVLSE